MIDLHNIPRDAEGIKCDCGGYADQVETTKEESAKYGCSRFYDCCSRAFVCCLCGKRILGTAEAPEMG